MNGIAFPTNYQIDAFIEIPCTGPEYPVKESRFHFPRCGDPNNEMGYHLSLVSFWFFFCVIKT